MFRNDLHAKKKTICKQYFTSFSKTFFPSFPKYPHLIKTRFPNQKLSSLSSGITCFTNLSFFIIRENKEKKKKSSSTMNGARELSTSLAKENLIKYISCWHYVCYLFSLNDSQKENLLPLPFEVFPEQMSTHMEKMHFSLDLHFFRVKYGLFCRTDISFERQ